MYIREIQTAKKDQDACFLSDPGNCGRKREERTPLLPTLGSHHKLPLSKAQTVSVGAWHGLQYESQSSLEFPCLLQCKNRTLNSEGPAREAYQRELSL